jgi:hypothetical protein
MEHKEHYASNYADMPDFAGMNYAGFLYSQIANAAGRVAAYNQVFAIRERRKRCL